MEPRDNFENITLPYVRNVKLTLLRDEIESISDEDMGRRINNMRRKLLDNVPKNLVNGSPIKAVASA